ncbi:Rrt8p [Sporobolomyces salmoneus]|uniref:Rrt8p n=1 Tax=Sporobolomyces salmoneus TaxID=183962 RepID=UPI0031713B44
MSSSATDSKDKAGLIQRQVQKGLATAKEDAVQLGQIGAAAVQSTAYLYPVKGFLYILQHPKLAQSLTPLLMRTLGISSITVLSMFVFAYFPQVALFSVFSGPLAFAIAVPVVLAESYFIISLLLRSLVSPALNSRIFDAILIQRGHTSLVSQGRSINRSGRGGAVTLGKELLKPVKKLSGEGLVRYLITLPLNLVPGVGTAVFLALNGIKAGPAAHSRYFELKKFSPSQRKQFVEKRRGAYTAFGATTLLLNLVPLVGPFFSFTSCAGAALWAADIEDQEKGKNGDGGIGGDAAEVEGVADEE